MAVMVMKRYELKYLLNSVQTQYVRDKLKGHMEIDQFGRTSIFSLYYDTPTSQLVRTSMEKPAFKEKIRLRSYGPSAEGSPVYLELKRKAYGIVYKRRVETTVLQVKDFFSEENNLGCGGQINSEITAFRDMYKSLAPACMIICDRTAYYEPDGDLRLTIDENPRYRADDLTFSEPAGGSPLLPYGWTIMEVKVQDAMPLWLAEILSAAGIRKASFSKYGEAYRQEMLHAQNGYQRKEAS